MALKFNVRMATVLMGALIVSGCSSIKVPDLDFMKLPEFKEEAENLAGYPNVEDAPQTPTDVRSDAQWDKDAKKLIAKRDGT